MDSCSNYRFRITDCVSNEVLLYTYSATSLQRQRTLPAAAVGLLVGQRWRCCAGRVRGLAFLFVGTFKPNYTSCFNW